MDMLYSHRVHKMLQNTLKVKNIYYSLFIPIGIRH